MTPAKLFRERLRTEAGLVSGVHPLAVTEMRVWPSARPNEARVLERNPEDPDLVVQGEVRE